MPCCRGGELAVVMATLLDMLCTYQLGVWLSLGKEGEGVLCRYTQRGI